MAHLSKIFSKTPVDIPNRSGFDISHENMLTMPVGTLVPILCEEVLPNETYSLGYMCQAQLPPMATDFYGMVDMRVEAFFVPNRILWSMWQNFVTMPVNNPFAPNEIRVDWLPFIASYASAPGNPVPALDIIGPGSLCDYLGVKYPISVSSSSPELTFELRNILPFLAYHKIYDDWYRNPNITKPLFVRSMQYNSISNLPWVSNSGNDGNSPIATIGQNENGANWLLPEALYFYGNDEKANAFEYPHLFSLHQRQWAKDYYTTASLYPQSSGDLAGSSVQVGEDPAAAGSFTIGQLRSANVLQRWLERNNIAGQRYSDQIKATWGIMPSDALLDRPLFLGSHKFALYNKSVSQSSQQSTSSDTRNPYAGSLGVRGGQMGGLGDGSLINKFTSTEHGFIMVLASIVPHAYYSTGTRRMFFRQQIGDFANPLLQGLGEQAVYKRELVDNAATSMDEIFGYQQQYSEYKYHNDEVHGLLKDGESLAAFALQRGFSPVSSNDVELSTAFLEIPNTFLDDYTAATYENGAVTWCDWYFNFKKISPLSEYVIPTLGDLKNTHKESVDYRGRYL